jgi:Fur family transcriptional regulator, ferric uptake regulator
MPQRPELLLETAGLEPTPLRVAVLTRLLESERPLQALDVLAAVRGTHSMNKVTLYRILDLLVRHGLALRHSSGERAFRYCAITPHAETPVSVSKPPPHRLVHCHFHCTTCGGMRCIDSRNVPLDCQALLDAVRVEPSHVDAVEIRLDGTCPECADKAVEQPAERTGDAD